MTMLTLDVSMTTGLDTLTTTFYLLLELCHVAHGI